MAKPQQRNDTIFKRQELRTMGIVGCQNGGCVGDAQSENPAECSGLLAFCTVPKTYLEELQKTKELNK